MKKVLFLLAPVAYVIVALTGCSDDDDGGTGGSNSSLGTAKNSTEFCQQSCAATSPISCPNDKKSATCEADCQKSAAFIDKCLAQANAVAKCQGSLTKDDLECDADGETSAKGDKCKAESDAFGACVLGS